jgi:SpoVK/Ycf46/Vps4 family AAA+-type ATPase
MSANKKQPQSKKSLEPMLSELVAAALERNSRKVELIAASLSRVVEQDNPSLASKLREIIGSYAIHGVARGVDLGPVPTDSDSRLEIVSVLEPSVDDYAMPILSTRLEKFVESLIEERQKSDLLIRQGVAPSTRILLTGSPGNGKTMLAYHIASRLNKKLVVLDISSAISSLLGKTGSNIKKVLHYAQENSAVLLLDEFDAVAKKRDDSTDLGEIKRVVNVLLMEMDNWSSSSLVIATSNHPEILDRAVWRRFDHAIEIEKPGLEERLQILSNQFNNIFEKDAPNGMRVVEPIAHMFEGMSASDICRYANNVKRSMVLKEEEFEKSAITNLESFIENKDARAEFCKLAKQVLGNRISLSELSELTGLSRSGVNHHVTNNK